MFNVVYEEKYFYIQTLSSAKMVAINDYHSIYFVQMNLCYQEQFVPSAKWPVWTMFKAQMNLNKQWM